MNRISCFALALLIFVPSITFAQVVRFETCVGDFDMVLNPTRNARLQGHVDNLIAYIDADSYDCTVINRADQDFVLQMGSFTTTTLSPPPSEEGFRNIETFDPITGVPAAQTGLSNTRGTVSLALPGDGTGGTNRNGGTSSFFVNVNDNSFLDTDFTVFAVVPDLSTIDMIMGLQTVDLAAQYGMPGNLAFSDVPLQENGNMVFIKRAFVIEDTITTTALTNAALAVLRNPPLLPSSGAVNSATASPANAGSINSLPIPEPSTLLLSMLVLVSIATRYRR